MAGYACTSLSGPAAAMNLHTNPSPAQSPFPRMNGSDVGAVGALLAVFVLTRLLWLALHPSSAVYWEENYRWIAAQEILSGALIPIQDYQADHYQGGSLVMILMTTALFSVFGKSVLAMKLSAVAFSCVTLSLVYAVGRSCFDRTAAIIASAAYIAGPPLVAYWGLVTMGSHGESIAFSLAQILILTAMLRGWRTPSAWAVFGLFAGLGLWFCYTTGISIAACGLTWLCLRGVPSLRELATAIAGTAAGMLPWFWYNATHGFVGLGRVYEVFGYGNPIDPWIDQTRSEKLTNLLARDWPDGLVLPFGNLYSPEVFGVLAKWAYVIPVAIGLAYVGARAIAALLTERRDDGIVFVSYTVCFLAVFLGSSFTIVPVEDAVTYRLLVPPAVILSIAAAGAASAGIVAGGALRTCVAIVTVAALLGSATATLTFASHPMFEGRRIRTDMGYVVRGLLLHRKHEPNINGALADARLVQDPYYRHKTLHGVGWGMEFRFESDGNLSAIEEIAQSLPLEERQSFLSGAAGWAHIRLQQISERSENGVLRPGEDRILQNLERLRAYGKEQWKTIPAEVRNRFHNHPDQKAARAAAALKATEKKRVSED